MVYEEIEQEQSLNPNQKKSSVKYIFINKNPSGGVS